MRICRSVTIGLAIGVLVCLAGSVRAGSHHATAPHHATGSARALQQPNAQRTKHGAAGTGHVNHIQSTATPKPVATRSGRHPQKPMAQAVRHTAHRHRVTHNPTPSTSHPLIVIDPGHGGRDPGAIGARGTLEKTITLATALELQRVLKATGRYRVALTRTHDGTLALAGRLAFARKHDADLLIAIHADASRDHDARGASVYINSGQNTVRLTASSGNAVQIANALSATQPPPEPGSAWLQYTMIEQLADDVRMVVTPARTAHLYVLGSHSIPSVLLEMGFLSNRQDEVLLGQTAHRRVIVQAIKDAIDDYFAGIKATASHT